MTTLSISADGQAIALACSTLALQGEHSVKPLSAGDWDGLSQNLEMAEIRPQQLLGMSAEELEHSLQLSPAATERLATLLSRGGQLGLELERLGALGIWLTTRADEEYPEQLNRRLGGQAPPVLFGAGPRFGLSQQAIAVVGSRDVDDEGLEFASRLGATSASQGYAVVSGAARGVDITAMMAAIEAGGTAIGITVDPLQRLVRRQDLRIALSEELLTLATPFHPGARWYASNAMRRNRIIYAMSEAGIVVASTAGSGGTSAGAMENLDAHWVPLHVREDGSAGNRALIDAGGFPLSAAEVEHVQVSELASARHPTLLDEAVEITVAREAEPAPEPTESSEAGADVFALVWPALAPYLMEMRTEREVAETFGLQLTQARVWLKRSHEEGLVEVVTRPKRYVLREAVAEQLIIDGA